MKKYLVSAVVVLALLISAGTSWSQYPTRDAFVGYLNVSSMVQFNANVPVLNYGYYFQTYNYNTADAFRVDYHGVGHYIMNLQANGTSVLLLNKAGNIGLGKVPSYKIDIATLDQNGQRGINFTSLSAGDGESILGIYGEGDVGTGVCSTDREVYGRYFELTINSDADPGYAGVPYIFGSFQEFFGSTDAVTLKMAFGHVNHWGDYSGDNTEYVGFLDSSMFGGESEGTSFESSINLESGDALGATGTGFGIDILEAGTDDTFYGVQINDTNLGIIGGTAYGIHVDLDDVNWDTVWSVYINDGSAASYFGSDVGIGATPTVGKLHLERTSIDSPAGYRSGAFIKQNVNPTNDHAVNSNMYALIGYGYVPLASTKVINKVTGVEGWVENYGSGNVAKLTGVSSWAYNDKNVSVTDIWGTYNVATSGDGTVSNLIGNKIFVSSYGGTVADNIGLHIADVLISGSTVDNRYGIKIDPFTGSTTTLDYAIYSEATQDSYIEGKLGLNTTTPDSLFEMADEGEDVVATISAYDDTGTTTPTVTMRKADNTQASPAPVDTNDVLGTINFNGYDNDSFDNGARIYAKADANWGAAERGAELYFSTRDGAGALTDQFKITAEGDFEGVTSKWWACNYISMLDVSPGGSGAVWIAPGANSVGGYQLAAVTDYLYFAARVCPNWDEASDLRVGLRFEVNVNNVGGLDTDTVDFQLICYYKGVTDTASKTQTLDAVSVVGKSPRYQAFDVVFTIDYDIGGGNDVDVSDVMSFRLNLETGSSEVDDVIANFAAFAFKTSEGFIQISEQP